MAGVGSKSGVAYDARGLVEPHAEMPENIEVDEGRARFDAADLSIRQINMALRKLIYEDGIVDVTVSNPNSKHSLAVGILKRCNISFEGSPGWFACGLIDGPEVEIDGRVGWSCGENMMSGVVTIERGAGSLTGAAIRGGDLIVKGDAGARTGIDQKGGTIIVMGDVGINTGFMMQRGHQVICGNAGHGLGDSMYDGTIYVGGTVASLGVDCVPGDWTDADSEFVNRKFDIHQLGDPPALQKFVCGKQLHNYDALEPSERKLVM